MAFDVNVVQVLVTSVVDVSQVAPQQIEVTPSNTEVLEVLATETLIVESPKTTVIEVEVRIPGPPGPMGPPGTGIGESVPYAKRTDFVGDDIVYKGEAAPGSAEGSAVWRISKITFVGEDIDEKWAGGTADFDKIWTDHLSLVYS